MKLFSSRNRAVPLGRYPLEGLRRADIEAGPEARLAVHGSRPVPDNPLHRICRDYSRMYLAHRRGEASPRTAAYTDDPQARSDDLKGLAYFFDASLVGLCRVAAAARSDPGADSPETHAMVLLVEEGPMAERGNPAWALLEGSGGAAAKLRATEIAVILALYLRRLGWSATAQCADETDVSLETLAVQAGLARVRRGRLEAPFIGDRFAIAAITTDLELPPDRPLAPRRPLEGGWAWWVGHGGTATWWERARRRARPGDAGAYPMESIKRVDETTTLIIDDEVPRVPKRSNAFFRAAKGDMGDKALREVARFAAKTPLASATRCLIAAQQPHQDGPVEAPTAPESEDPARNRRALKTLLHHLGADIAGTCEAKRYAWYSHHLDGTPLDIYHRNAAVLVIDQGFDTMEGASGDDWISATQSMRAYLRGAQIAGIAAAWVRAQGHSARSHTNIDSDVIQTPLILLAGLGEMSRIGETVLNPFIGPRSKSAVLTTNMPLAWDRPIDFGLQDACSKCMKCARECPCDAITYGGPVMFNGYEQWKQDVQKCTSYRVTNQGGAACGRCMKMCPFNNEGLLAHRVLLRIAIRFPWSRARLAKLDDTAGRGSINPVKRWWQELEIVDGAVVAPKRFNRRTLDVAKGFGLKATQKISYINADMLPPADFVDVFPIDRKAGLQAAAKLETPLEARARVRRGEPKPGHYSPPP